MTPTLINDIKQFKKEIKTTAKKILQTEAGFVLAEIVDNTRVRVNTPKIKGGKLKSGWTLGKPRILGDIVEIDIYNKVNYASFIEDGHYYNKKGQRVWWKGDKMADTAVKRFQSDYKVETKFNRWVDSRW